MEPLPTLFEIYPIVKWIVITGLTTILALASTGCSTTSGTFLVSQDNHKLFLERSIGADKRGATWEK